MSRRKLATRSEAAVGAECGRGRTFNGQSCWNQVTGRDETSTRIIDLGCLDARGPEQVLDHEFFHADGLDAEDVSSGIDVDREMHGVGFAFDRAGDFALTKPDINGHGLGIEFDDWRARRICNFMPGE